MGIETLAKALAGSERALLDTMVFSRHLGDHPRYVSLTEWLLHTNESGDMMGLTTTVTLAELLTRPAQANNRAALRDYEAYLLHFPNLEIAPLDVALARETALVRGTTGLRTPDAVQIAAARMYEASAIITNDHRWAGKVHDRSLILLDDHTES